jgi:hypothetical protein
MKQLFKTSMPIVLLFALGFSLQFLQSCRKSSTNGTSIPYDNSKTVVASIMGFVTDESGALIDGATITTGGYTTISDANGFFHFDNITTPSHATTVLVSKGTGYFKGSRTIAVNANQKHVVKVSLIAKGIPATFVAVNGGNVSFANGLSLSFPAGGIVNQSTGLAYNGQVYVYAHKIDPTTETGMNTMPGDLRGVTANGGEERLLQSFGMMVAELYSVDGQLLQIKSGFEATMTLAVPTSLQASAPATIPLWYFDDAKGIWVEDGVAILTGGKYVGKVKHFSFWNCDTPAAAIDLEMTLVDQNGTPLSGYLVKLTNTANNNARTGNTNTAGWVGGLVYPNANLQMEVYALSSICGTTTPIYSQTVVTSTINLNLGTITIPITTPAAATISGSIVDCSGNPISNGSVVLSPYNIVITPNALGQYSYSFPCTPSTPITMYAYNLTNNVYGTSSASLVNGLNNVGALNACGSVTPYLSVDMTNVSTSINFQYTFNAPASTILQYLNIQGTAGNVLTANNSAIGNNVYMMVADTTVGTHPVTNASFILPLSGFTDTLFTVQTGSTITYTGYPTFPGDVIGNYSINLIGNITGNNYTVTGSFRAPRQN